MPKWILYEIGKEKTGGLGKWMGKRRHGNRTGKGRNKD